jgi:LPXTG-motif cell wall-anchored protein
LFLAEEVPAMFFLGLAFVTLGLWLTQKRN